jgi:ferritin-like metal-binding protein YciE
MGTQEERARLAAKFEYHADEEGKILAEYRTLSEQLGDSSAGTLVSHILTEEELHHLLLRTMAKWLREPSAGPARAVPASANRAELLRVTRTLRQHERETIDACRRLKSQLSDPSTDLLGTLLEAMMLDSEKHHRLLEAAEKLIEG